MTGRAKSRGSPLLPFLLTAPLPCLCCEDDSDTPGRCRPSSRADNDLHVAAQPCEAIEHFRFTDTAKLAA